MIQLGSLVYSQRNNLGVGKVVDISDTQATVEYFYSVSQRIPETFLLDTLTKTKLQRQTRCYIWLETQAIWIIGRVSEWDEEIQKYQVHLPDKEVIFVSEVEIYVRCNRPQANPMETLAMKGQETPYFHDRRLTFVQSLISQRAVCRGMTGLISANIQLYPHQVEVVRRVLEDPIQRYLLADEVGLGKTVEAGVILRQYLLDEPKGRAVIIVPEYLVGQWQQELEQKFYLSHFPKQVVIITIDEIQKINPKVEIGLVIIDEAHHIAGLANSQEPGERQKFELCKDIAHKSDRLLLLSATPVLNNERDFLAMLHLLDPTTYHLNDVSGFRTRVENRQQIGRVLLGFKEDANPFVIKSNLKLLRNLFAEDNYLLNLANDLESCLQKKSPQTDPIIRSIRTHISETYRLHRRMLRNRRASVEDVVFDRNIKPQEEYDLDERSLDIHQLLDEWRSVAPHEQEYQRIYLLFFLGSGTWLGILEQVINARLGNNKQLEKLIQEFTKKDINILTQTPKFSGEEEILQSLLKTIQQPPEAGERIEHLQTVLLNQLGIYFKLPPSVRRNQQDLLIKIQQRIRRPISGDTLPKFVVFTSFVQTCTEIVRYLIQSFGETAVVSCHIGASREQIAKNLINFQNNPNCFILVCDRSGEEGHNLQFADWLIHFDIPFSPNRLEQRIGRLDRIGSKINFQSCVFLGLYSEESPHNAWFQLLKNGFTIFQQSIASLQFYIDEKLPELETVLFQLSAVGILEIIEPLKEQIKAEILKINEQYALDEIDALDDQATEYFQALDNDDACHQQMQQATETWICQTINFRRSLDTNKEGVISYYPSQHTLISVDEIKTHFATCTNNIGTFNRRIANKNTGVNLYRIGERFIDSLSSYIHWDDRGQCFAMWRVAPSWNTSERMEWFGFRFNYIIETNLAKCTTNPAKLRTLKRLADGLFPPRLQTIFIDARSEPMSIVDDLELLKILQTPYKAKGSPYRDYNLAKNRLSILDNFVESSKWAGFCHNASNSALNIIYQRPDFQKLCEKFAKRAEQKLSKRLEQLHLRINRINQEEQINDSVLQQELLAETELNQEIIAGIQHPHIRLDSVGFMIISGRNLQLTQEGDE
ncbi:MAG: DEAD/DEAH box helicase family protein [Dolichospermum sp. DET50]|nr:DEAD/DEAH box helicase family protein [Dolichospermum sp. DET66]MBS3034879.1 DEAD/DEAH box helicase family protein [Dolichospermum sp. DET67]MBS3040082.1 DEAD/DEAH box helicase family protein [Dolichospermum sp. DET50]QSX67259.1 MAG: DEAD/DEAH box helicase family protein [Dolichospermum sp. DET69]